MGVFEIEKLKESRAFRLTGEMDLASKEAFNEALVLEIGQEGDLTLDLSGLTFIDSTGIQALIKAAETLHERGRLILRAPGKNVLKVFDLMRMDTAPNVQISGRDLPEGEGR
jgi:anti-anti-sigma factor